MLSKKVMLVFAMASCLVTTACSNQSGSSQTIGKDPNEGLVRVVIETKEQTYSSTDHARLYLSIPIQADPSVNILVVGHDAGAQWSMDCNLRGERISLLSQDEFELEVKHFWSLGNPEAWANACVVGVVYDQENTPSKSGIAKFKKTDKGFSAIIQVEPDELSATVTAETFAFCYVPDTENEDDTLVIDEDFSHEKCALVGEWR